MIYRNPSSLATFLWASALAGGIALPHRASAQPQLAQPRLAQTRLAQTQPQSAPVASDLERDFVSPPAAARPWVYWFVMDGNFTRQGITADLEAMQRAGIGGVIFMEVNVGIPRGPVQFLSPGWQDLWKHAVRESERLGIQITLNGGPGWTGSGGPWVKAENSMQIIRGAALDVTGPHTFDGALPRPANRSTLSDFYQDVRVLAFPKPAGSQRISESDLKGFSEVASYMRGGNTFLPSYSTYPSLPASEVVNSRQVIDLSARMGADGRLQWEVPPGDWTILRFGATNNGASTYPAPAPGLGMESDKFSQAGLEAHFNDFVGPLLKTVGPRVISPDRGWNGLHIDSWEVGAQNWTPAFITEFKRRRGYDPLPYLPTLSGLVVDSSEKSERFLWDWRQTCQELVIENHVAHFKTLAARHGFGLSIEPYDKVTASDLSLGAPADVPMGEFWAYDGPQQFAFSLSEAASVAHTNARKIVGAEAFTSGGPTERWTAFPGNMKALGDWAFTQGINRFVIHRYQHQPDLDKFPGMTMGPFGVHWERTQTWWDLVPAYHRYLARCQFVLRQGLPVSDVCFMAAEGAPQVFVPPDSATRTEDNLPERSSYSFDGCAPEIVAHRMTVKNGQLFLPDGTGYRVLVLPERDTMTPALLREISNLVRQGATVIGPRPHKSPSLVGYPQSDTEVEQLGAALWGDCDGIKRTEHRFGKGRVLWHRDPTKDLSRAQPSPLFPAKWIWSPEGQPALAAPVGKRFFRRTLALDDLAGLSSASIALTADNSFDLSVNGARVGGGDEWRKTFSFDVTRLLKRGANEFSVAADNGGQTPNPAGLIALIRLRYRDGRVVEIPTDNGWQARTSLQATDTWTPALELGAFNAAPWNLSDPVPEQYGDFGIVTRALQAMKVAQDFESDGPVRSIHRRGEDADFYFVANREERLVNTNCTFRVAGKTPELWDPLTGERRALPQFVAKNGRVSLPLRFEPLQSWFVVFRNSKAATPRAGQARNRLNFPPLRRAMEVTGGWQVSFDPKWGGPAQTTFSRLESWSQNPQPGVRYYSGKAVYRKKFVAPPLRSGTPVYLDLGTVKNLAQVRLNGRDMGTLWCAPWRVDVSGALHPGENQLEITVANLWPNRLIGDLNLPAEQRLTSTTWNPFSASDPLLLSGLLGPVTLVEAVRAP